MCVDVCPAVGINWIYWNIIMSLPSSKYSTL
jgi:hypothetical protein